LNEKGLKRYWDLRSKDYADDTGIDPSLYLEVFEYLSREGIFVPRDTVLDVGCGPGTYALPFAGKAKSVVGLDVSEGMLSKMMTSARKLRISNVRPACSSWEKYDGTRKFDLVFSSFCPAVNDACTLLKMEERSRRGCCCLTSGDICQASPADRLWELLTGESAESDPSDALYLFNILYYSGRSPNLRSFHYDSAITVPAERLIRHFIAYFEMYMELDLYKKRRIEEYVDSISTDGVYRKSGRETLYAIFWDV
jgi:SAM-dependent methyltransferase